MPHPPRVGQVGPNLGSPVQRGGREDGPPQPGAGPPPGTRPSSTTTGRGPPGRRGRRSGGGHGPTSPTRTGRRGGLPPFSVTGPTLPGVTGRTRRGRDGCRGGPASGGRGRGPGPRPGRGRRRGCRRGPTRRRGTARTRSRTRTRGGTSAGAGSTPTRTRPVRRLPGHSDRQGRSATGVWAPRWGLAGPDVWGGPVRSHRTKGPPSPAWRSTSSAKAYSRRGKRSETTRSAYRSSIKRRNVANSSADGRSVRRNSETCARTTNASSDRKWASRNYFSRNLESSRQSRTWKKTSKYWSQ